MILIFISLLVEVFIHEFSQHLYSTRVQLTESERFEQPYWDYLQVSNSTGCLSNQNIVTCDDFARVYMD